MDTQTQVVTIYGIFILKNCIIIWVDHLQCVTPESCRLYFIESKLYHQHNPAWKRSTAAISWVRWTSVSVGVLLYAAYVNCLFHILSFWQRWVHGMYLCVRGHTLTIAANGPVFNNGDK